MERLRRLNGATRKKDRGCGKGSLSCPRTVDRCGISILFLSPTVIPLSPLCRPLSLRIPIQPSSTPHPLPRIEFAKNVPSSLKERFRSPRSSLVPSDVAASAERRVREFTPARTASAKVAKVRKVRHGTLLSALGPKNGIRAKT